MRPGKFKKAIFAAVLVGTMFQATAGCGEQIASLLADTLIQAVFSIILGGITGGAT